jgi:micrococcal nuclease
MATLPKKNLEGSLHTYAANVVSVYDGDTFRADIVLGLDLDMKNQRIRLARIDTPEIKGRTRAGGIGARNFVRERIENKSVILQTIRDSKGRYGRYLAEVWYLDPSTGNYQNLNDELLERGLGIAL